MVGISGDHTFIGLAAVIAAIGSAAATIISAINGKSIRKIDTKMDEANGSNGKHEEEA
jgi:hypothetical protein